MGVSQSPGPPKIYWSPFKSSHLYKSFESFFSPIVFSFLSFGGGKEKTDPSLFEG